MCSSVRFYFLGGAQKLLTVPERQAERLEVGFPELGKDLEVDVITSKGVGVLPQPLCL